MTRSVTFSFGESTLTITYEMQNSGALTLDHHDNKCPTAAVGYRYLNKPDRHRSHIPIPHSPRHLSAVRASCNGMKLRQALGERKHA